MGCGGDGEVGCGGDGEVGCGGDGEVGCGGDGDLGCGGDGDLGCGGDGDLGCGGDGDLGCGGDGDLGCGGDGDLGGSGTTSRTTGAIVHVGQQVCVSGSKILNNCVGLNNAIELQGGLRFIHTCRPIAVAFVYDNEVIRNSAESL